jgi:chloride channel protein, CIC family
MRTDFENAPTTMPIGEAQMLFSPAMVRQVVLLDPNNAYAGIVPAATLHSVANRDDEPLGSLAQQQDECLLPTTSVREILKAFERSEADVLAVVDRDDSRIAIGTLSESHVLRTYGEELERRNQELFSR